MAPEHAMFGHFSVKLNIFSFGVLILEIVTGQKITCFRVGDDKEYLPSYVSIMSKYKFPFSVLKNKR